MQNDKHRKLSKEALDDLVLQFYNELINETVLPSTGYQKKFLLQLINAKIAHMEFNTGRKKILHFVLRVSVMILSGVSTVILGLKSNTVNGLSILSTNITLIVTACVTLLSSLAVFWDTENYWIRNKIMLNKLKELRYEFVFFLAGANSIETADLRKYLDKFLASLGDEYWEKFLKDVKQDTSDEKLTG